MNGQHMNHYPGQQYPHPPQGSENGTDLGAIAPHAMAEKPQWVVQRPGAEQQDLQEVGGEVTWQVSDEQIGGIGRVGTSKILSIHQKEFTKDDLGKVTGVVGEAFPTGEWRTNPQGQRVQVMRNHFVTKKLEGVRPDGTPIFATTEVSPDQDAIIEGIHNKSKAAAKARTRAPQPLQIPAERPLQQFGPAGADNLNSAPAVPEEIPSAVRKPDTVKPALRRSQTPPQPTVTGGMRFEAHVEPVANDDEEYPSWRDLQDERGGAPTTQEQLAENVVETEAANPVNQPSQEATPKNTRVGGAVAAENAAYLDAEDEEMPEGLAAIGGDVVGQGTTADVDFGEARPHSNKRYE